MAQYLDLSPQITELETMIASTEEAQLALAKNTVEMAQHCEKIGQLLINFQAKVDQADTHFADIAVTAAITVFDKNIAGRALVNVRNFFLAAFILIVLSVSCTIIWEQTTPEYARLDQQLLDLKANIATLKKQQKDMTTEILPLPDNSP